MTCFLVHFYCGKVVLETLSGLLAYSEERDTPGSTGPAFLSAIVRNVSALVMSSSQWSTYRLYFEGREMSRERIRGGGVKEEGVTLDN